MRETPVRGTQSFVNIMAEVWHRPSLSALEIAWRWLFGALLVCVAGSATHLVVPDFADKLAPLSDVSVFQPVLAIHNITIVTGGLWGAWWPLLRWLLPLAFVGWNGIAALGRTVVLRRLDASLNARRVTLFVLSTLRSALLLGAWWLWSQLVFFASRSAILAPAARGDDPSVVLFAAMLIVGTLVLYVAWAVFSWFLQLAPLLAMRGRLGPIGALQASFACGKELRGKLIEINLVMNIVRIALIVLAMVFSATPLPFSEVATPEFLRLWWSAVALFYLAFSDYFHAVRAASYLSLHRVLSA